MLTFFTVIRKLQNHKKLFWSFVLKVSFVPLFCSHDRRNDSATDNEYWFNLTLMETSLKKDEFSIGFDAKNKNK